LALLPFSFSAENPQLIQIYSFNLRLRYRQHRQATER
jgi:hypothetical protein